MRETARLSKSDSKEEKTSSSKDNAASGDGSNGATASNTDSTKETSGGINSKEKPPLAPGTQANAKEEKAVGDLDYNQMSQELQVKRRDSLDKIPGPIIEVDSAKSGVSSAESSSASSKEKTVASSKFPEEMLVDTVKVVLEKCYGDFAGTLLESA